MNFPQNAGLHETLLKSNHWLLQVGGYGELGYSLNAAEYQFAIDGTSLCDYKFYVSKCENFKNVDSALLHSMDKIMDYIFPFPLEMLQLKITVGNIYLCKQQANFRILCCQFSSQSLKENDYHCQPPIFVAFQLARNRFSKIGLNQGFLALLTF